VSRERLTEDAADEFWPRYSPKTGEIAWHAFRGTRRHLFVMAPDGRDRQQITDGPDDERCPTWSPDGRTVYYLHNFNAPDTELRAITRGDDGHWSAPRTLYRGSTYPPTASPDGRWVAIAAAGSVVIVNPRGDSTRVLVPRSDGPEPRALYVDWSDDSETIYYLAVDPAERASIWGVPVAGGTPRLMVRFDDPTREWHRFGFAAGHGRLWFTVGDCQSDVWAAEVQAGR
jgi:hypothetical protein